MRIKINTENYKLGDTKIVEKFLTLPLTIGNEKRWLETCRYKVRCWRIYREGNYTKYGWAPVEWID